MVQVMLDMKMTWVPSPDSTRRKENNDAGELSSDHHICAVRAHRQMHTEKYRQGEQQWLLLFIRNDVVDFK